MHSTFLPKPLIACLFILLITLLSLTPHAKAAANPSSSEENLHTEKLHYKTYIVPKNSTFSHALKAMQAPPLLAYQISKLKHGKVFIQLQAGDRLQFGYNTKNQLKQIRYPKSRTTTYLLHLNGTASQPLLQIEKQVKTIEQPVRITGGVIQDSLYLSGKRAGLSDKTIMKLADLFSWEIDFMRQVRPGDTFKVIYQQKYIGTNYIGDGDILAAEITTQDGKTHYAFLFKDATGKKIGYYDEKGHNLRKAFLRNPVDYVRISSRFQPRRYHPILHRWRAHRGVDYAAPIGTPIRVTGDGTIIKRTWSRGYGRVIFVQHAGKYTTVYGHMSRFGRYKKGDRVKQGNIIGYVGMSGLATGPHLHYEFRIHGKHVDPLKVKFPDAAPLPKKYRSDFQRWMKIMKSQLDRTPTQSEPWLEGFE